MAELNIKAGNFYRLRNGMRARIFMIDYENTETGEYMGVIEFPDGWIVSQWFINGRAFTSEEGAYDIVAEWK